MSGGEQSRAAPGCVSSGGFSGGKSKVGKGFL